MNFQIGLLKTLRRDDMLVKEAYLSSFNMFKTNELKNDFLEDKKNGLDPIFILPNGKIIREYREEYIEKLKVIDQLNLYTFDDIIGQVSNRKPIGEELKELILKRIMLDLKERGEIPSFEKLIDKDGFLKDISSFILYLKRDLIGVDNFKYIVTTRDYSQFEKIYREYEIFMDVNGFVDREDQYLLGIEQVKTIENNNIYVDGFYDFREIEWKVLEEISKSNNIYMNIPFKLEGRNKVLDTSLRRLEDLGFKLIEISHKLNNYEEIASSFKLDGKLYDINLTLIEGQNKELELKGLVLEVNKLLRQGLRHDQIAIIGLSDQYEAILESYIKRGQIYLDKPREINLGESSLALETLDLLSQGDSLTKAELTSKLNRRYFSMGERFLVRDLTNAIYGIDFERDWELINYMEARKLQEDYYKDLLLKVLASLKESKAEDQGRISYFTNYIREQYDFYNLEERISSINRARIDTKIEDIKKYKAIIEILGELDEFDQELGIISREEFARILKNRFDNEIIPCGNRNHKGIDYVNLIRLRNKRYKAIFFLGMNEGNFPARKNSNFLLGQRYKKDLEKLKMEKFFDPYILDNEEMKFLIGLASVTDYIYFTIDKSMEDNRSIFLEELLAKVQKSSIRMVNMDYSNIVSKKLDEITSQDDYIKYLITSEDEGLLVDDLTLNKLKGIWNKSKISRGDTKRYPEYFGDMRKSFSGVDEDLRYSSTMVETYLDCPYRFYLKYILKVNHKDYQIEDEEKLNQGNIYHSIFKDYYNNFKDEFEGNLRGVEFLVGNTGNYLKSIVEKYYGDYYKLGSSKSVLDRAIIYKKSYNLICLDIERLKSIQMYPCYFEQGFGYDEDIYIKHGDKSMKLAGRIDRIDKLLDREVYGVLDYKTSDYKVPKGKEINQGKVIQLGFYILGLNYLDFHLASYGIINKGEFKNILGDKSIFPSEKMDMEEVDRILNLVKFSLFDVKSKIESGYFPVEPEACSEFCKYGSICRYKY